MFAKKTPHTRGGFTIIEVMVTVSIIAILSAILLYQFKNFDSKLLLKNLAYEVAIVLREAQVYGVSVQGGAGNFQYAYGVHFDTDTPTNYILFRDSNPNGMYDVGEMVSSYTIGRGNRVIRLCDREGALCSSSGTTITTLDITFKRPDSDASFVINRTVSSATSTYIGVGSATASYWISVYKTGRISI